MISSDKSRLYIDLSGQPKLWSTVGIVPWLTLVTIHEFYKHGGESVQNLGFDYLSFCYALYSLLQRYWLVSSSARELQFAEAFGRCPRFDQRRWLGPDSGHLACPDSKWECHTLASFILRLSWHLLALLLFLLYYKKIKPALINICFINAYKITKDVFLLNILDFLGLIFQALPRYQWQFLFSLWFHVI